MSDVLLQWSHGRIEAADNEGLFRIWSADGDSSVVVNPPSFAIDHKTVSDFRYSSSSGPRIYTESINEWELHCASPSHPDIILKVIVRVCDHTPVIRFRYVLSAQTKHKLTKDNQRDALNYLDITVNTDKTDLTEIQLSNFNPLVHSYFPVTVERNREELSAGVRFAGPIAVFEGDGFCGLLAFEHGSEHPDTFLEFSATQAKTQFDIGIHAAKGNYYDGQPLSDSHSFESVWFELALTDDDKTNLLRQYRTFFLKYLSKNTESRQPYIFYNTWNYQERNKYFDNKPYLSEMNEERMRQEIEVAHRLGIDVFVIDTGWYNKTGDWIVNPQRFSDNLRGIKSLLDSYGMKLGLWFNPIVAAETSAVVEKLPNCVMTKNGEPVYHEQIWETEGSYGMCLVSEYSDWFIDKLVELNRKLGVTYFKWDAIQQYGCNSPLHWHGSEHNSPEERADSYAYEMGKQMIRIAQEVTERCPEAIVDFDVTEGGRFVGLGFLAVGKYFLVNNGPYFHNFDIPRSVKIDPDTINVFFYPGPARPRFCRTGVLYDEVIPSNLFLTHYLPDGPIVSQANSAASMVLGGNGIWGDLVAMTDEDVEYFAQQIRSYKKVAHAVVKSYPRVVGTIGASPEIREKIDSESGTGLVVFLTVKEGTFSHVTQPLEWTDVVVEGADEWEVTAKGQLKLTVRLGRDGAKVVYIHPRKDTDE